MLEFGFRKRLPRDVRDEFVIAASHPDRLRRPPVEPGAAADERFQQALIWNVFRTLELMSPAFWLRRFHMRLFGEPSLVAPQIVRIRLWRLLPLPPIQQIDGAQPSVLTDVIVETEHAVWTLVVAPVGDCPIDDLRAADVVDAGTWFAGARTHHCGVIGSDGVESSPGSVLKARYTRSRDSAILRSASRGPVVPPRVDWGVLRWGDLSALLEECRDARILPAVERTLARNAADWLREVGVPPAPEQRSSASQIDRRRSD